VEAHAARAAVAAIATPRILSLTLTSARIRHGARERVEKPTQLFIGNLLQNYL